MSPVKIKNHVSRNGFDLSRKVCFTAKFGQLLPVLSKMMFPGDKFKVDLQEFTRTLPVNTAAFARMRHYFDFYFVPMRLMWRDFPSFITSMADTAKQATSIDANRTVGTQTPYFTFQQLLNYLKDTKRFSSVSDDTNKQPAHHDGLGFSRSEGTRRLLSYLGYYHLGSPTVTDSREQNVSLSPFPLLAYQKIYNDYFRYSQWEKEQSNTYNVDYLGSSMQIPVSDLFETVGGAKRLKSVDPNMFDLRYANYNKDMFLGVLPNKQYGAVSTIDMSFQNKAPLYRDSMLPLVFSAGTEDAVSQGQPATQTAIGVDKASYNSSLHKFLPYLQKFQLGPVSGFNLNSYTGWTPSVETGKKLSANSLQDNPFIRDLLNSFSASFSILQLRAAEAVQKFREIALSNNQDYKSQIEAQFGVKVSKIESGLCEYLGGISHDISINEVVNTSLTDSSAEPTIMGKGLSSGGGKTIEYEAHTHGIFMCIYHATVLPDYNVQGYERDVLRTTYSDFPNPLFDRLGMEPVPLVLLTGSNEGLSLGVDDDPSEGIVPLGYAPRYFDLKTSYDVLLGGFNLYQGGTLKNWITPIDPTQLSPTLVESNPDWQRASYWSFKVNPHVVDNLFSAKADDSLNSDPLLVTAFFDLKAVRNYDRNGLPY